MKKRILITLLLLAAVLLLTGCGKKKEQAIATSSNSVPTVLNTSEYVLYQNIFYNGYGDQYDGKDVTKRGIFTTVQDAYNGMNRYYVWGYNDMTKCCDWQWEMKVDDPSGLPANGSLISVSGTFASDEQALDGYWITSPAITVQTTYTGKTADVDMSTMSDTLERVQLYSVINHPEAFEGKTAVAYGRIFDTSTLQDPYYDGSWTTPFSTSEAVPATGTSVVLRGVLASGVISNCTIEKMP